MSFNVRRITGHINIIVRVETVEVAFHEPLNTILTNGISLTFFFLNILIKPHQTFDYNITILYTLYHNNNTESN